MIKGGTLKKMVIYVDAVAPSNGIETKQEIRMTEVQLPGIAARQPRRSAMNSELNASTCVCCSTSGDTSTPCGRSR